jgi:hypothetical protein
MDSSSLHIFTPAHAPQVDSIINICVHIQEQLEAKHQIIKAQGGLVCKAPWVLKPLQGISSMI